MILINLLKIAFFLFYFVSYTFAGSFYSDPSHDKKHYSYIFAPGMGGTDAQLARYLPSFTASTGEQITSANGLNLLDEPVSIATFAEVTLKQVNGTYNPLSHLEYFCTGLSNKKYGVTVTKPEKWSGSCSVSGQSFNVFNINIGQDADITCLYETYLKHIERYPDTQIIGYGTSRGAATMFNFISWYQPKCVSALVLEGIFDTPDHVLRYRYGCLYPLVDKVLQSVTSYKKDGPSPLVNACEMPKDIPILLVTSLIDVAVPSECTLNVYTTLCAAGHKKVHLLILKNSKHPSYTLDDEQDKHDYKTVVHAFYKNYGLPHIPEWAEQGKEKFANSQPLL